MSLPTFDALEQVPEPFRAFYLERDGKFVADLVPGAEVVGLRQAKQQLLTEKKELQQRYEGIDPEEYRTLKAGTKKEVDGRLTAAQQELAQLRADLEKERGERRAEFKKSAIVAALAEADGEIALLEPIVDRFVEVETVEGRHRLVVKDAQGAVRYRDGMGTPFGVADLLGELSANPQYARAFNQKVGSGGNAKQSSAPAGAAVVNVHDPRAFSENLDAIAQGKARLVGL